MLDDIRRTPDLHQPELTRYLRRWIAIPQDVEDVVQATMVRALESADRAPADAPGYRRWLFRVATHLAIDHYRLGRRRREVSMEELREVGEADPEFMRRSMALVGSPETQAIAAEHLTACFTCTARELPQRASAALLLKEVHGLSLDEVADVLAATPVQVKNWLQDSRRRLDERFAATCALITKQGVCHQCDDLKDLYGSAPAPADAAASVDGRLALMRAREATEPGPWHLMLFDLLGELSGTPARRPR